MQSISSGPRWFNNRVTEADSTFTDHCCAHTLPFRAISFCDSDSPFTDPSHQSHTMSAPPPPPRGGMSLYANLLESDSSASISRDPVVFTKEDNAPAKKHIDPGTPTPPIPPSPSLTRPPSSPPLPTHPPPPTQTAQQTKTPRRLPQTHPLHNHHRRRPQPSPRAPHPRRLGRPRRRLRLPLRKKEAPTRRPQAKEAQKGRRRHHPSRDQLGRHLRPRAPDQRRRVPAQRRAHRRAARVEGGVVCAPAAAGAGELRRRQRRRG